MKESLVLFNTSGNVTKKQREDLLNQKAVTFWLTGLSGSGKTTIAYALEKTLFDMENLCYVLDGDNIRCGLNKNLGFSNADRSENIRRIAEVSKLMNDAGLIVITSFITPFIADRQTARDIIGEDSYIEIYLNTTLSVCESRDPKGLYKKARAGELHEFTGISSAYETPKNPHIILDTNKMSVKESITEILASSIHIDKTSKFLN
jgi:adenylyl-sulfate kinase